MRYLVLVAVSALSGCGMKYVEEPIPAPPVPATSAEAPDSTVREETEQQSRLRGAIEGRAAVGTNQTFLWALSAPAAWLMQTAFENDDQPTDRTRGFVLSAGLSVVGPLIGPVTLGSRTERAIESQPAAYQTAFREAYDQEYRQRALTGGLIGAALLGAVVFTVVK